jgi:hypothetical protein
MPCNCPEVHTGYRWEPFCEAHKIGEIPIADAEPRASVPLHWRCPRCRGAIVTTFFGSVMEHGEFEVGMVETDTRADFRCRVAACGWANYVLWPECDAP